MFKDLYGYTQTCGILDLLYIVSGTAVFVLKRDVKLQLTNLFYSETDIYDSSLLMHSRKQLQF